MEEKIPFHGRLKNFPWAALAVVLFATGCDNPGRSDSRGVAPPVIQTERGSAQARPTSSNRQRQAAFLNRIRQADPNYRTVQKALLNENNELGLILGREVEMDSIPPLMRSMLTQMAREFPNQDLTIIAYAPSTPPRKIGTARLDSGTRQMTYTPETRQN